jgi:hypothetical protein
MQLTSIEYNAIMMAINNARNEIADDNFIDGYHNTELGHTNDLMLQALDSVETKIISHNVPF